MGFQSPCPMWTMWLEEHSATLPMLLLNWHQLSSLMGFSSRSAIKNLPDKAEDGGSIPGSGNPPEEEMATHPGNPMGRGALQASVHGVTKSWIKLSPRAHGLILLNNILPMFLGLLKTPGPASLHQA